MKISIDSNDCVITTDLILGFWQLFLLTDIIDPQASDLKLKTFPSSVTKRPWNVRTQERKKNVI